MLRGLVSVVMANRDYGRFLDSALRSAVRQTYGPIEIIIVDGGSSDCSEAVYRSYDGAVSVVHEDWRTLAEALNIGITHARGDYVARLDPDDEWEPVKIKRQVDWLESHPKCALVHCSARHIDERGRTLGVEPVPRYHQYNKLRTLLVTNPVRHSSVVINRHVVQPEDLWYDPELAFSEDYELWMRIFAKYRVGYIDQPLLRFRRHASNVSITRYDEQERVARSLLRRYYKSHDLVHLYPGLRRQDDSGASASLLSAHCHLDLASRLAQSGLYAEACIERRAAGRILTDKGDETATGLVARSAVEVAGLHPLVRLLIAGGGKWLSILRPLRRLRRKRSILGMVENPPRLGLSAVKSGM